jgi:hypothetical protein
MPRQKKYRWFRMQSILFSETGILRDNAQSERQAVFKIEAAAFEWPLYIYLMDRRGSMLVCAAGRC